MKEQDFCEGCGCNPCDCGWGNDIKRTSPTEFDTTYKVIVGRFVASMKEGF